MQVPRTNRPALKMEDAVAHLEGLGVNTEGIRGRASTRKRGRSLGPEGGGEDDEAEDGKKVRVAADFASCMEQQSSSLLVFAVGCPWSQARREGKATSTSGSCCRVDSSLVFRRFDHAFCLDIRGLDVRGVVCSERSEITGAPKQVLKRLFRRVMCCNKCFWRPLCCAQRRARLAVLSRTLSK